MNYIRNTYLPRRNRYQAQADLYQQALADFYGQAGLPVPRPQAALLVPAPGYLAQGNQAGPAGNGQSFMFALWDEMPGPPGQEGWDLVLEGGSRLPFPAAVTVDPGPSYSGAVQIRLVSQARGGGKSNMMHNFVQGLVKFPPCSCPMCQPGGPAAISSGSGYASGGRPAQAQAQGPWRLWQSPSQNPAPGPPPSQPRFSNKGMPGFDGHELPLPDLAGDLPDVFGVLRGYRWWSLAAPDLSKSPAHADEDWPFSPLRGMRDVWQDGENLARCLTGPQKYHEDAEIPHSDCSCVTPGTRVLTSDLRWVPAGDLEVGEHLFAFDEHQERRGWGVNGGRKYRDAVVACTDRDTLPCYDLRFEDGTEIRVSADHQWLCYSGQKGAHWVRTDELRAGEVRASWVVKPFSPWTEDMSREAGYLAAAFDGEGCLFQKTLPHYQFRLSFAQVDNPMLAEVERCLKEAGFLFTHQVRPRGGGPKGYGLLRTDGTPRPDGHNLEITSRPEMLRFLGSIRPVRLLPKFRPDMLGRLNMQNRVRLVSKTYAGKQEVIKLGTTAGTYFAEGLASHNCGFWAYWTLQVHDIGAGQLPVCGVVEGYGATVIGERGFRAAKARIVGLHLPFTIQPAGDPDPGPLGLGLPAPVSRPGQGNGSPASPYNPGGTVYGRGNPWHNHPKFTGRVYDYRGAPAAPEPPPELDRTSAAGRQSNRDRAEAWLAVIGDRLSVMYPSAKVFETRAAMEAEFPPDLSYVPDGSREQCPHCSQWYQRRQNHPATCESRRS